MALVKMDLATRFRVPGTFGLLPSVCSLGRDPSDRLIVRLYFVADHVEVLHPKGQPTTGMPQLIMYFRLQKVEIWSPKNVLVTTLGQDKFLPRNRCFQNDRTFESCDET
jgi:hypothetical protein